MSTEGNRKSLGMVERVASHFRKPLLFRFEICLNILAPHVAGKDILELGCGSGYFAFRLHEALKPRRVTGMDFSPEAIKRAAVIALDKYGEKNPFSFKVSDVATGELPPADITIGLGLLDYLDLDEIARLFSRIPSKYFLFTFSEKRPSVLRFIHIVYMKSQNCPKHYYCSKDEIRKCCEKRFQEPHFVNHPKLSFSCIVHNLPEPAAAGID